MLGSLWLYNIHKNNNKTNRISSEPKHRSLQLRCLTKAPQMQLKGCAAVSSHFFLFFLREHLNSDLRQHSSKAKSIQNWSHAAANVDQRDKIKTSLMVVKVDDKYFNGTQWNPYTAAFLTLSPPHLHLSLLFLILVPSYFQLPLKLFFSLFLKIQKWQSFCHFSYNSWWLQTESWLQSSGVIGNCRCERAISIHKASAT